MPIVGKMSFPYTAAGEAMAKKAAKKTGKKMVKKTAKKMVMKKMGNKY